MSTSAIGDDTTPVYEFDWGERSVLSDKVQIEESEAQPWEEIPFDEGSGLNTVAVETLADLGRQDPECDVTLVGFE